MGIEGLAAAEIQAVNTVGLVFLTNIHECMVTVNAYVCNSLYFAQKLRQACFASLTSS